MGPSWPAPIGSVTVGQGVAHSMRFSLLRRSVLAFGLFVSVGPFMQAGCSGTSVGPDCTPPFPPSGLSFTPSDSGPSLTWRAPASGQAPTSYIIEIGDLPGQPLYTIDTHNPSTSYKDPLDGHLDGRGYVRVRASNSCGTSAPSAEVRFDNHGN